MVGSMREKEGRREREGEVRGWKEERRSGERMGEERGRVRRGERRKEGKPLQRLQRATSARR